MKAWCAARHDSTVAVFGASRARTPITSGGSNRGPFSDLAVLAVDRRTVRSELGHVDRCTSVKTSWIGMPKVTAAP